jgi:hypothetical protein
MHYTTATLAFTLAAGVTAAVAAPQPQSQSVVTVTDVVQKTTTWVRTVLVFCTAIY